jgi:ATP-binding cassette, subfamily C, bacterial CydC
MSDVREVLKLAQPPFTKFAPGLIFGIFSAGSAVSLLAVSAWLITRAGEMPPIMYLNMAIVGVRFFALSRASFRYVERLSGHDAAFRSLATLRVAIYRRLVPLAPDGLSTTRRGDLLSRLVADVDQLQDLPLRVITPVVVAAVVGVGSVIAVWAILPIAGLALLIALILAALAGTALQSWLASESDRALSGVRAQLDDTVMDVISRVDVLTAFGALDARVHSVERADSDVRYVQLKRAFSSGAVAALVSLIAGLATLTALWLGVPHLVFPLDASETPGLGWGTFSSPYLAIVVLVPMAVFEVFQNVPQALGVWRAVRSSALRIAEVTPQVIPTEIPQEKVNAQQVELGPFESLDLENISATWPRAGRPALSSLSLSLRPGECVLIQGPSGSGKTTLAHVLVRFLDNTGSYLLNGRDARTLPLDQVRRYVGLVEQSPHMFAQSLRQNLLFANPEASDEDLMRVLSQVGLAQWVSQGGGLDSQVGERGKLVSGGQAQRIAVARALLHDFPVLILDEPTANVDPGQADALIRDVLGAARTANRAVALISHVPIPQELVTSRITLE